MVDLMNELNVQLDNLCQVRLSAVHAFHVSAPVMRWFPPGHPGQTSGKRGFRVGCMCLVQFLPQDKVQSFAQMTPKQLLEESERALADGKYYRVHQELVKETKLLENSERVTTLVLLMHPSRLLQSETFRVAS